MAILVAFKACNSFVEIQKMTATTATGATASTMCLMSSSVEISSSVDKKSIVARFFFLVLLLPLHIFLDKLSFDILPVEIIGVSCVQTRQEIIVRLG